MGGNEKVEEEVGVQEQDPCLEIQTEMAGWVEQDVSDLLQISVDEGYLE